MAAEDESLVQIQPMSIVTLVRSAQVYLVAT